MAEEVSEVRQQPDRSDSGAGAPVDREGEGTAGVLDNLRTQDVGTALDQEGIAVRAGHHCAQPILRRFGVESTVRASLAPYNNCEDIDALVAALHRIRANQQSGTRK